MKRWGKLFIRACFPSEGMKEFIVHNRRRFGRKRQLDLGKVVLVGMDENPASTYCNSRAATYIAERSAARIDSFDFHNRRNPVSEALYSSFGAMRNLSWKNSVPFEQKAECFSNQAIVGLQTKWDLLNLRLEGFLIGDLIYDTYLRQLRKATVRLDDPLLKQMIFAAAKVFYATRAYFLKTPVIAVIPWRTAHYKSGIIARLAFQSGIPVYLLPYVPSFFLLKLDPILSLGMRNPTKRFPYYRYREVFNGLSSTEQQEGRLRARAHLSQRLSGKPDASVLIGRSAYDQPEDTRILMDSPKPKVLIMLHDFCDCVHSFRRILFPDFYEWARFTFERASRTDYEWYAKPHPNSATWDDKNVLNAETVASLSKEFPKIHILDPNVSNRQLIEEGVAAAFMVHGTAGHEFAALGIPVVNAGDNLHVAFDFNLNPKTVEEYASCIDRAGRLNHHIDQRQVDAFYYMHYFYFREKNAAPVNPVEEGWRGERKADTHGALRHFIQSETPEKTSRLKAYFEDCLTKSDDRVTVSGL